MDGQTTIPYKLHHVGVLCSDVAASTAYFRDVLGHEVVARYFNRGAYDLTFLGSGSELLLELIGPPFSDGEQAYFETRGGSFHHIAFAVPDVDVAFAELTANGLGVAWAPDDFLFVRHCGVIDDSGIVVEILQEQEPLARVPAVDPGQPERAMFLLHHFDIFSDDWRRTRAFYARHFGMRSLYEYIYDDGGASVYLADVHFDANKRQALVEVMGPPYEEPRERSFAAQFGTGMDHIGYVVADTAQAQLTAVARGSAASRAPYQEYGTEMCWLKDVDGNDLELMLPLDKVALAAAFKANRPIQPNRKES